MSGPGIWECHLSFSVNAGEGMVVEVAEGAFARVNGHDFRRHRLRNGDLVELGRSSLSFQLAPVQRQSLGLWSSAFWAVFFLVGVLQVYLIARFAAF